MLKILDFLPLLVTHDRISDVQYLMKETFF